jgi:hypothetical protein
MAERITTVGALIDIGAMLVVGFIGMALLNANPLRTVPYFYATCSLAVVLATGTLFVKVPTALSWVIAVYVMYAWLPGLLLQRRRYNRDRARTDRPG